MERQYHLNHESDGRPAVLLINICVFLVCTLLREGAHGSDAAARLLSPVYDPVFLRR
jgi:hypothetical protein